MAFFNYSTMQMTAKIVYYGPGLCGKTTNLQFIYDHTTNDSRGEMVSLETQTDRTLFFDLLPMEVGSVAGFKARIQLYTVPGQVFYNTTRKLVLKGVDGVVFVADSQTPMISANKEALDNLAENLESLGLSIDTIPMVLQYNKRDLPDIATVEELTAQLHRSNWPTFEASAITGQGVVETLRGISKLTLLSLRKQLESSAAAAESAARTATARKPAAAAATAPTPTPTPTPTPPTPTPAPPAVTAPPTPTPQPPAAPTPAPAPAATPTPAAPQPPAGGMPPPTPAPDLEPPRRQPIAARRDVRLDLDPQPVGVTNDRVRVSLRLEDGNNRVLGEAEDFNLELDPPTALDTLLLRVNVTVDPED